MGVLVAAVVCTLYFLRVFEPLADWLNAFFGSRNFYPPNKETVRLVWLEITVICLISMWACWWLPDLPQTAQKAIVFFVFLIVTFGVAPTLALYGIFFEPFSSMLALFLGTSAAMVFAGTELGARKRNLEAILGQRVSRGTFRELMESKKAPNFDGKSRDVTVLTCELFDHTQGSDRLKAGEFLKMTNLFRRVTSSFLAAHGAYIDESGPDVVRAFFGILREDKNHAERAVRAALELRTCLRTLNQEFQSRWFLDLECGVGLSSGEVITGIFGSSDDFFLSATGPSIEFSRRLAKANARYGSDLMVGPPLVRRAQEIVELRPMEMFYDPDTEGMVEIYQLLGLKESFSADDETLRDHFWEGTIKFREGNYEAALENFSKARIPGKEDSPLEYFIRRTQEKMTTGDDELKRELTEKGHARVIEQL